MEPLHLAFGSSHFKPIEKINQNMPIILPRENRDTEVINLESNDSYKESSINSQKTWMSDMLPLKNISRNHTMQLNTQLKASNVLNDKSIHITNVINCNQKIDCSDKMVTRISVVSKSNQNTKSDVLKKRKRMFWTIELNDLLINLMRKYTSNSEIASYFMSQNKELNVIFDQVTRHIKKLKQGKIKITTKEQENESSEIKKDNKINHDDVIKNEKRSYTKWKKWDESMKVILNEPNNNT